MKSILTVLISFSLIFGIARPADASEGGGRDPVVVAVEKLAMELTMSQIIFTPLQIILLIEQRAYGIIPPEDIQQFREGKGGLFGSLFSANKKKVFEELARRNFVKKVGRAYRIGDLVFVDTMFFNTGLEQAASEAGHTALQHILNGNSFVLGPAKNPLGAIMHQQILALMFFMTTPKSKRMIYQLDPTVNAAEGIEGVKSSIPGNQPLAISVFLAALLTGQAQPIGDVWQIGDKVVVAAPLEEIFPGE